jgi:hypothetical protein
MIYVSYLIGFVLSVGGVMIFGVMLGWVVDRVSHTAGTQGTDEDAVDARFYGNHYKDEEDY